ncbi:exodeoxyribonuclease VII, large subunit [Candidatus Protochlamydia naegleriophila]|uniref:Exodeoxyribonuclease 7 large subunit n=1 Tax=Candidatus Protochlamydia naegleriophila TaxID=389348 RepID=A0A0U5JCR0_9BACT|nr:exodeoxyribonuclease VII large subunit [Candidatus Protochlamydia naegleriophila]CUI16580.1 exodeoxyribonuclease VII, large subunit [Candidatus Protochlamydia naegleriophila]
MENGSQQAPLLTVTQLTQAIKLSLESMFPFIYMQGEISNFKIQTSGHLYFSLKDANAQISAVMFKGEASALRLMPKGGDHVMIKGEISVYPPKGNYQLIVRELSYMGLGELLQKLEQLKIKLHQKGWFKSAHKKPLPRFPKRIGVITSPTGAVIQDILHILTRRFSGFQLILNPVKVQGEGAAKEIAEAIKQFNHYQLADVLIVGRGGGSLEDLWAFNEEVVAEAIYNSDIPIISAVGHETDHCIADYVADVRAPTPSAAAEIVIAEKGQQLEHLRTLKKRMQQSIQNLMQQGRYRLEGLSRHPFFTQPSLLLEWRMQKMDDSREDLTYSMEQIIRFKRHRLESCMRQALALKPINQIQHLRRRLLDWNRVLTQRLQDRIWQAKRQIQHDEYRLQQAWTHHCLQRRHLIDGKRYLQRIDQFITERHLSYQQRLLHINNLLKAIDPKNLLKQGYSILFAEKESFVINSVHKLKKGQQAKLLLSDGEALITINEVHPRE